MSGQSGNPALPVMNLSVGIVSTMQNKTYPTVTPTVTKLSDPYARIKLTNKRKVAKMTTLNTKDFLESYKALHNAKYPTLNTNEHVVLSAILSVSIEWKKSVDDVQKLLDKKTQEQKLELEFFENAKAGK